MCSTGRQSVRPGREIVGGRLTRGLLALVLFLKELGLVGWELMRGLMWIGRRGGWGRGLGEGLWRNFAGERVWGPRASPLFADVRETLGESLNR